MSLPNRYPRWARELENWLLRRAELVEENSFILTFYVNDGCIVRRDLSTTVHRKKDAELAFPDGVEKGLTSG